MKGGKWPYWKNSGGKSQEGGENRRLWVEKSEEDRRNPRSGFWTEKLAGIGCVFGILWLLGSSVFFERGVAGRIPERE